MAYQEWKIYTVKKEILTTAADPMGDCSWTLPFPKTYEVLPDLAAKAGDWDVFKSVMTDLLFLWRKNIIAARVLCWDNFHMGV